MTTRNKETPLLFYGITVAELVEATVAELVVTELTEVTVTELAEVSKHQTKVVLSTGSGTGRCSCFLKGIVI